MASSPEILLAAKDEVSLVCQKQDVGEKSLSPSQPTLSAVSASRDDDVGLPDSSEEMPLQRWNESKTNMFRYFATLYSFTVMGMNDAAIGVCSFAPAPMFLAPRGSH